MTECIKNIWIKARKYRKIICKNMEMSKLHKDELTIPHIKDIIDKKSLPNRLSKRKLRESVHRDEEGKPLHRDIFSTVEAGEKPEGWSGGEWFVAIGETAIDNWGAELTSWNHFLKYDSGSRFFVYDKEYTDFDYTTHMQIKEKGKSGAVVFRYKDENNYYYYQLTAGDNLFEVGKVADGEKTVLAEGTAVVDTGKWYNLRVQADGGHIVCKISEHPFYIDTDGAYPGTVLAEITDQSFESGNCGYYDIDGQALYTIFAVSNTAQDRTIENDIYRLTVGAYGQIKSLKLKNEPYDTDFVVNEETHRMEVGPGKFLGEMKFTYTLDGEEKTAATGDSEDNRVITLDSANNRITVEYMEESRLNNGIKDFQVTEEYALVDDYIQFDITIKNDNDEEMTFEDVGLPVSWNNHWQFQSPYESYVGAAANFISYNSSYVLLERAMGGGNKLLFIPDPDTDAKLEYRKFVSRETTFTNPPEEYYIYSNAVKEEGQGYIPSTSLTLQGGESKKLSFRFHKVGADYEEAQNVLYEEGSLDISVNPGMILPKNVAAEVDLHTKKEIDSITASDKTAKITENKEKSDGDHKIYTISFEKLGRNDITITYDGDKKSVLQFWIEEPIKDALQRRTDYLMDELRITDPSDPHYNSFLEIDNITGEKKPGGNGCNNNDYEQMYDGPAFIAEKNVYYPVQEEISAVDDYLIDLVWAKEVVQEGSQAEYLRVAGMILKVSIPLSGSMGTMGEQTTADICAALDKEGYTELASEIRVLAERKAEGIDNNPYPFGSEFGTDSTAEEGAYFYSKMFGNTESMKKTVDKAIAWKGKAPVWYWQTTGNRQDNDWWLFQYTVGLHGALLNDWYFNNVENPGDYWSMVYPFKFSPFVHINSGQEEAPGEPGTVWWNYKSASPYNWDIGFPCSESGEADISLWAGLQILSSDVVLDDPSFGTAGYGCEVTDTGDALEVVPLDGLFRRLNIVGSGLQIELGSDIYSKAVIENSMNSFSMDLTNLTGTSHSADLTVTGLDAGKYQLLVDGNVQAYISVSGEGEAVFTYQINDEEKHTIEVRPYEKEGALKVALVGDETLAGNGTSDWETHGIAAQLETMFEGEEYETAAFIENGAALTDLAPSQECEDFAPDMVVLLAGNREIENWNKDSFSEDYRALLEEYQNMNSSPVVYAVTNPAVHGEGTGDLTAENAAAAAAAIREQAGECQAVIIDLNRWTLENPQYQQKNAYLDNNGAEMAASQIYTALTARAYTFAAPERDAFQGLDPVDYDSQKYSNDFESGDLAGWQNYEGSWNVSDGAYHGSGNGKSILESMSFSDFIYEVDICVNEATNWGGPVLRVTEPGAGLESYMGYCVNLNVQENAVWLSRHTNNWQHVANWPYDLEFNQTYHLRIVAEGPVITVYLDGEELGSYTDPDPYLEGYVGFRSYGTSLTMDNMSVRALGDKAPTITQEPSSAEILTGESAEFSVSAEGYEGARLTYQWQTSSNRVRWTDISGAESAVYRLENADLEQNGTYFRCIVSNEVDGTLYTAVSAAAELTVKGIPSVSSVTITPEQASVEAGTLQRFTAKVEGENDPDTAVVWSVSGGTDGTRIEDGVLYVSADEPAGTVLTVTAASAAEPDIKASAAVTVLENTTTSENVQLYYEFDEGEGNEVKDYSSNSYNGMIGGTINDSSWTEEGFAFGGTNYLRLEDATLVSLDMTIVYRVKRTSEDAGTVSLFWGKNQSDYAGKGLWINSTSENAVFVSTDDFDKNFNTTGISTEDFYPLDEWVEVAVSVSTETGEYAIYRNGVEVETSGPEAVSVTVPTDSYNTIGMAGYDNEYLTGYTMGKYMILNKYISEGEALAICNGKFDPGNEEQNQPPTAGGDFTRQLKAGESIQLNADDLATDPDGDPLTIAAVTAEPDRSVAEAGLKEGVLTITAVAEGGT